MLKVDFNRHLEFLVLLNEIHDEGFHLRMKDDLVKTRNVASGTHRLPTRSAVRTSVGRLSKSLLCVDFDPRSGKFADDRFYVRIGLYDIFLLGLRLCPIAA